MTLAQRWKGEGFAIANAVGLLFVLVAIVCVVAESRFDGAHTDRRPVLVDFYPTESLGDGDFNFARTKSHIFLVGTPRSPALLTLRVVSPEPLPERPLHVSFDLSSTLSTTIGGNFRTVHAVIPFYQPATTVGTLISLETVAASLPGDTRELGILVEEAAVQTVQPDLGFSALWSGVAVLAGFLVPMLTTRRWILSGLVVLCISLSTMDSISVFLRVGLLAVGVMVLVALAAERRGARFYRENSIQWGLVPVLAMVAVFVGYVAVMSYYSIANHNLYRTNGYDLGIYDQVLWLISHGYYPYISVMGMHTLGNHAAFLMYPLSLLYVFFADVRLLLVVQSIAVATAIIPIYLIAKAHGHPALGVIVGIAYVAHPAIQNMNLFDVHMEPIAATALLWMLWSIDRKQWGFLVLSSLVVLAAKENFSITVAFVGLWLAIRKEWRMGGVLVFMGACWFLFTTQFLQPSLNGQSESIHLSRFSHYGSSVPEILGTFLLQPQLLIGDLIRPENSLYLWSIIIPFALLPLVRLDYFVLAAPALFLNMMSSFEYQRNLWFHYHGLIVAVAAIASLYALIWLNDRIKRPQTVVISVCILVGATIYGQYAIPLRRVDIEHAVSQANARPVYRDYVLSLIPPDARVSVSSPFHPHVSHRVQAYVFPHPFRWTLFYNRADMPYEPVVDYIVYDQKREAVDDSPTFDLQARGLFEEVVNLDGVILFRRSNLPLADECFGEKWEVPECTASTR